MIRVANILPLLALALVACGDETGQTGDGPARGGTDVHDSADSGSSGGRDAAAADTAEPLADATGTPDVAPDTGIVDIEPDVSPADASGAPDAAEGDVAPSDDVVADVSVDDTSGGSIDCEADDEHRYACCVFDAVNAYRAAEGLEPYTFDPTLAEVGFYYAGYMADNNVYAHSADGMNFGERLDSYDVAWSSAGENLQKNNLSGWAAACAETVNGRGGWAFSSQGHREAMLGQDRNGVDKGWTHAAAGVARSGRDWYVAMYFVRN